MVCLFLSLSACVCVCVCVSLSLSSHLFYPAPYPWPVSQCFCYYPLCLCRSLSPPSLPFPPHSSSPLSVSHIPLMCQCMPFHLSPRLCPPTAGCSPPSMSSIVVCLLLSYFTFHLGSAHPLQDVALHQCLPLSPVCCFPISPRLCPPTAGCPLFHFCLLLSYFTFHLGSAHPLQDVVLYQCLPLSSVCCFPISPFT